MRFLLIILLVIIGFRLFVRFVFPLIAKYFVKKASDSIQEQTKRKTQGEKVFEKGDIEIRKPRRPDNRSKDSDDDYVDYTEV